MDKDIKILTKELAKQFIAGKLEDLSCFTLIDDDAAEVMANINELDASNPSEYIYESIDLDLSGLTNISSSSARYLASIKGDISLPSLCFDGMPHLSTGVAQALSEFRGDLSFGSLKTLSLEDGRDLAKSGINIDCDNDPDATSLGLNGLTSLTPELATALGAYGGSLCLSGINDLPPDVASGLCELNSHFDIWCPEGSSLWLNGLLTLDPASAEMLATVNVEFIVLEGLMEISVDAARELSKFAGELRVSTKINELISKSRKTKRKQKI
jgi:hypothetical protein